MSIKRTIKRTAFCQKVARHAWYCHGQSMLKVICHAGKLNRHKIINSMLGQLHRITYYLTPTRHVIRPQGFVQQTQRRERIIMMPRR